MDVIYLDHNASTPLAEELLTELPALAHASRGNASSSHSAGREARRLVTSATDEVAAALGCVANKIYWTSGASESNSWAIASVAESARARGAVPKFLLSPFEHDSTLLAAQARGEITFLRALPNGRIVLEHLEHELRRTRYDLVSIVAAHNETGVIQPIDEIAAFCKAAGVSLHLDCAQTLGRVTLDLGRLAPDFATFSAHKIGGPKGVGMLVAAKALRPLIAGTQQRGTRGGTENALGLALTARAVSLLKTDREPFPERLCRLHAQFEAELKRRVPETTIYGESAPRLCNTTYAGFRGVDSRDLVMRLDLDGVCVSVGSACGSGTVSPSRALLAMGCDERNALSAVRFSSGRSTTDDTMASVTKLIADAVADLRRKRVS